MGFYKGNSNIGLCKTYMCYNECSIRDLCFEYLVNYDRIFKRNGSISFVKFEDACENPEHFIEKYGTDCKDIVFSYFAGSSLTEEEKVKHEKELKLPFNSGTINVSNIEEIIEFENKFNSVSGLNFIIRCIVPSNKVHKLNRNSNSDRWLRVLESREPTVSYLLDKITFKEDETKFYLKHEFG